MNEKNQVSSKELESIMGDVFYKNLYENWVKNFAINLPHIWDESSANILKDENISNSNNSAIVIGWGPSLKKFQHLQQLANSKFTGKIICCDAALSGALEAGITPENFKQFYVVTIDPKNSIKEFYENPIIKKYGNKIKGIFTTVVDPEVIEKARNTNIKIHWLHALLDYQEGQKSFNQISATMVRANNHLQGLPAIQTGGNVGTSSWFIAWRILRASNIGLIGIDQGWSEDDPWEKINTHGFTCEPIISDSNNQDKEKLFPKIYNSGFDCYCILDPIYQYYSEALKEFIKRSPENITTINATEGGSIFGDRISCMKFKNFLENYS